MSRSEVFVTNKVTNKEIYEKILSIDTKLTNHISQVQVEHEKQNGRLKRLENFKKTSVGATVTIIIGALLALLSKLIGK